MNAGLAFDALLCLLIVSAAGLAVCGRHLFASIAFFVTYGILIGISWLRLGAIDVALAEVAIGAGLTGVLLIGVWAAIRRRRGGEGDKTGARSEGGDDGGEGDPVMPRGRRLAAAVACSALACLLVAAILALPGEAPGLLPQVTKNLADSGVSNPVTAVLLNFRAYDTLMESVVLLIALVAVWALTPPVCWGGEPGLRQHARGDGVLATFGKVLPPLGAMVAVYLIWAGSDRPGGAFQGGTVLAAVWLLAVMAGLAKTPRQSSRVLRLVLVAGPVVFLGVGLAGAGFGVFLGFPVEFATMLILFIELALAVSIAATLALLVAGTPMTKEKP
ncbi:MAG: hydrogenase subunit MbhD domain-containing protein [Pigmentiphaga sp.]